MALMRRGAWTLSCIVVGCSVQQHWSSTAHPGSRKRSAGECRCWVPIARDNRSKKKDPVLIHRAPAQPRFYSV